MIQISIGSNTPNIVNLRPIPWYNSREHGFFFDFDIKIYIRVHYLPLALGSSLHAHSSGFSSQPSCTFLFSFLTFPFPGAWKYSCEHVQHSMCAQNNFHGTDKLSYSYAVLALEPGQRGSRNSEWCLLVSIVFCWWRWNRSCKKTTSHRQSTLHPLTRISKDSWEKK